jgi:hypothetical protein
MNQEGSQYSFPLALGHLVVTPLAQLHAQVAARP